MRRACACWAQLSSHKSFTCSGWYSGSTKIRPALFCGRRGFTVTGGHWLGLFTTLGAKGRPSRDPEFSVGPVQAHQSFRCGCRVRSPITQRSALLHRPSRPTLRRGRVTAEWGDSATWFFWGGKRWITPNAALPKRSSFYQGRASRRLLLVSKR